MTTRARVVLNEDTAEVLSFVQQFRSILFLFCATFSDHDISTFVHIYDEFVSNVVRSVQASFLRLQRRKRGRPFEGFVEKWS